MTVTFSTTHLEFGEVGINESSTVQLDIRNDNDFPLSIKWTMYDLPEGLSLRILNEGNEIIKDNSNLNLQPDESVRLEVELTNNNAVGQSGGPITHRWILKFYEIM